MLKGNAFLYTNSVKVSSQWTSDERENRCDRVSDSILLKNAIDVVLFHYKFRIQDAGLSFELYSI